MEGGLKGKRLRAKRLLVHRAGVWRGGSQPEDQEGAQG